MESTSAMTSTPLTRSLTLLFETKSLTPSQVIIVADNAIRPVRELVSRTTEATLLFDASCRCLLGESFDTIRSSSESLSFINQEDASNSSNDDEQANSDVSPSIQRELSGQRGNSRWDAATSDTLRTRRRPSPGSPVPPVRSSPSPSRKQHSPQKDYKEDCKEDIQQSRAVSSQDRLPNWLLQLPMETSMSSKVSDMLDGAIRISSSDAAEQQQELSLNVIVPASA